MKKKAASFFSNFLNYFVIIGLIVFVSFLFPYESGQSYEYEIGRPWIYEDLNADASFGILKSDEQLAEEKKQIEESFSPYFLLDTTILPSMLYSYEQQILELKEQLSIAEAPELIQETGRYLKYGQDLLKRIYTQGILKEEDLTTYLQNKEAIHIVSGNTSRLVTQSSVLYPEKVKRLIKQELRKTPLQDKDYILPVLLNQVQSNVAYDAARSKRYLEMELSEMGRSQGVVESGEQIVQKGQIITREIARKIKSYENQGFKNNKGDRTSWWTFLGYLLLTVALIAVFLFYLQLNANEVYARFNNLLFMTIWVALYSYLVSAIDPITNISIYIIPFCIVPIVIKNFFNDRLALFVHIIIILLASFLSNLGYEFMFIEIFAGIVTILSLRLNAMWNRLFTTVVIIFSSYIISFTGLSLIREGSLEAINYTYYLWFFLSAFLTFLAYPLLPLLERAFGFTSSITLSELTDMNHPLLRKLSVEAPGTLQHSLQVANLAESAADAIGADSLLIKVAALYHDVGKTEHPEYFIENQSGESPHKHHNELESAKIIIDHVSHGAEMAKKHKLPKNVIDFIWTHHGTTRVEYFYRIYKQKNPDKEVSPDLFQYPGPKPQTKEQAIMMLADSLEASCKSLKNPTGQDLDRMIDTVIQGKLNAEQFSESDLTFQEMKICTTVFRKMLRSIHHVRVEYPKEEE